MLNRIKGLLRQKAALRPLLEQMAAIRQQSDIIVLCPTPTDTHWLGINRATHNLFPSCTLDMPQEYSRSTLSGPDLVKFSDTLAGADFRIVVLSGFPAYWGNVLRRMRQRSRSQVYHVFHGTFSERGGARSAGSFLPVQLAKEGLIDRVGVIRQDIVDTIGKVYGIDCMALSNMTPDISGIRQRPLSRQRTQVGALGHPGFNKNLHNQVVAAILLENTVAHVTEAEDFVYLNRPDRIVGHGGTLPRDQFLSLLGSMDINLHLSFSESFGQVALESLALGVPCLVSPTTNVLDLDPGLRQLLTVTRIDSPTDIARHIGSLLPDLDALRPRCTAYADRMDAHARKLLEAFLNG